MFVYCGVQFLDENRIPIQFFIALVSLYFNFLILVLPTIGLDYDTDKGDNCIPGGEQVGQL
jgi:hypothetical protein